MGGWPSEREGVLVPRVLRYSVVINVLLIGYSLFVLNRFRLIIIIFNFVYIWVILLCIKMYD